MQVILYTTHCPRCQILTEKLEAAHIEYEEVTDEEYMVNFGIDIVPMIELVNGTRLGFKDALDWIKENQEVDGY